MELFFAILILACLPSFVLSNFQGDALYALKISLKADKLTSWNQNQVNPCTWVDVTCDSNNNVVSLSLSSMGFGGTLSPEIGNIKTLTSLSLPGNGITGGIPKEFGNLTNLTTLNLENNNLSGEIPTSLGNLTKLQFLTLSANNLYGTIPESLSRIPSLSSLMLDWNNLRGQIPQHLLQVQSYDFTGNHLNCSINSPPFCASEIGDSGGSNGSKIGVILGIVGGCIAILLLVALSLVLCRGRNSGYKREVFVDVAEKRQSCDSNNFEDSPSRREFDGSKRNSSFPVFDLRTVIAATNNFSAANELGKGGFGSVYKGLLQNRMEIAIKRLSKYSRQGAEEFKNEVALIAKLQHRNLVRILGCCIQGEEKMLIYEYLPNKSLDSFIFDETKRLCLDWRKRFEIICGIARGILYLHQDSRLRIIHRDLKASNILLDNNLNPKISDFGMARIVGGDQIEVNTNRVVGTYGYMSPEYAMQGVFSIKSDVYSFGVLLLEIIVGKKNGTSYHDGLSPYLIEHVWDLWKEGKAMEIVDASLGETYPTNEVSRCIQIGLLCVQEHARDRPTMLTIVFMLGYDTTLPSPKQPAFISTSTKNNRDMLTSINEVSISEIDGR